MRPSTTTSRACTAPPEFAGVSARAVCGMAFLIRRTFVHSSAPLPFIPLRWTHSLTRPSALLPHALPLPSSLLLLPLLTVLRVRPSTSPSLLPPFARPTPLLVHTLPLPSSSPLLAVLHPRAFLISCTFSPFLGSAPLHPPLLVPLLTCPSRLCLPTHSLIDQTLTPLPVMRTGPDPTSDAADDGDQ
ncbi:hypothetical protein B0H15DRAFT_955763 [Mycena belliarum]|uniref:Uncharacterized protein n=1 Tax=Mycena belliarum TaxID=1033014 RepID=A0AAD6TSE5_9AGAR|nr:hypothetical protein B0H15DRAFT_955763 [Mycena belliae]